MPPDPKNDAARAIPITQNQGPLVEGEQGSILDESFHFPLNSSSEGAPVDVGRLLSRLETPPRDPRQKDITINALQELGKVADAHEGDRSEFAEITEKLRTLCRATNEVDVKKAIFIALEKIGLVEAATYQLLRHESHSDYLEVSGPARHSLLSIATQRSSARAA